MNKDDDPVAWGMKGEDGLILDVICPDEHDREAGSYTIPLYTHPKEWVGLTEDEPVAFKIYKPHTRHAISNIRDAELPWVYDQDPSSGNVASMWVTPVKATPPQREWVGLNGADWNDFNPLIANDVHRVAEWVEKILRERNK
jgi:hypothetical protein